MKIETFEDIDAWQKARDLVNKIYEITGKGDFQEDYSLKDQIRRASVSVISNIAEGFDRQSDQEFIRFLYMAKGSVSEVQTQLYIAKDQNYITSEEFNVLYEKVEEISRLIGGLIRYLKKDN